MKINRIEFQLSNQCNRQCKWCPAFYKKQEEQMLNIDTLSKMIETINNNINYFEDKVQLTFDRYNEPLLYTEHLIKCVRLVKSKLKIKNLILTINTNGDYLTKNNVETLSFFDRVQINGYDKETKVQAIIKLINIFGSCICNKMKFHEEENIVYFDNITYVYNKSEVMNFRDRGGSLKINSKERTKKCNIVGKFLMIEYDGCVYPCCDTTQMIEQHSNMCCGNILNDNFEKIINKINKIETLNNKICKYCTADICLFK